MSELSQTVKNFLVEFEYQVMPLLKDKKHQGVYSDVTGLAMFISTAASLDPQLRELLDIKSGNKEGKFLGVTVKIKSDVTVESYV